MADDNTASLVNQQGISVQNPLRGIQEGTQDENLVLPSVSKVQSDLQVQQVPGWLLEAKNEYKVADSSAGSQTNNALVGDITNVANLSDSSVDSKDVVAPNWLNQVKFLGKHEQKAKLDDKGNVILTSSQVQTPKIQENVEETKDLPVSPDSVDNEKSLDGLVFEPPISSDLVTLRQGAETVDFEKLIMEPVTESVVSPVGQSSVQTSNKSVAQSEAVPTWIKNLETSSVVEQKLNQDNLPVSDAQKKILEYITPPNENSVTLSPQEQAQKASLNFEGQELKTSFQEMPDQKIQDKSPEGIPAVNIDEKKKQEQKLEQKKTVFADLSRGLLSVLDRGKAEIEKGKVAGISEAQKTLDNTSVGTDQAAQKETQIGLAESTKSKLISLNVIPSSLNNKNSSPAKILLEEKQKLIEAEKMFQEGMATVRDLIAPSSMEIKYDSLRIEGMYSRSFYVYAYPRYLDTNWLSPLINFDVTMDIAQFIYPIESATIMRILRKKVTQMQSSMAMNADKGLVRDPGLETAYEDAEQLRTEIQRGQEKFFQFAMYFTLFADDEKKLVKVSKQIESILGSKLILTKRADLRMEHGFNSTLPLCLDEIEVHRNMNTSPLSTTFPFTSTDLTSNQGVLYGLNRHNDSLIIFDRFSLENANSVVFAKSGAGKSYAVKLEILRYLMLGTDVIVIDPENEYEALTQTVGGSYLRVSLTSDRRINPFDLPAPMKDEELQPGDLLRANIINLHGLLKIMLGGVTPLEEGIIDKALNDVYALKGITMDILDPSEMTVPTMEDLYDLFMNMEGGQSLGQRLQKFTQGTYSGIFNKPTNIDLKTGLMVFSIRDLEDGLRPIAMYIILNFIWNRVRSSLKRRILVVDEAWNMMQYEDSAKFLFGLVKRARKYYLGITTITQDVEDFMKSPYGKPIVTNSSMQLLLKQAPAAMETLTKIFNLTEGEKYMLLNSGIGQGLFFAGLKHVAIQCIASYTEDKIVTTNPEEILRDLGSAAEQKFEN